MDEEIVLGQPPEAEEAPSTGADAPEAATDAAATEGAGGAPEEQEAEVPPEPTSAGAGARGRPAPRELLKRAAGKAPPQAPRPLQKRW